MTSARNSEAEKVKAETVMTDERTVASRIGTILLSVRGIHRDQRGRIRSVGHGCSLTGEGENPPFPQVGAVGVRSSKTDKRQEQFGVGQRTSHGLRPEF